jgi:hypothetical protein
VYTVFVANPVIFPSALFRVVALFSAGEISTSFVAKTRFNKELFEDTFTPSLAFNRKVKVPAFAVFVLGVTVNVPPLFVIVACA